MQATPPSRRLDQHHRRLPRSRCTGTALSNLLTNLTPLAFISSSTGAGGATQLYNTERRHFPLRGGEPIEIVDSVGCNPTRFICFTMTRLEPTRTSCRAKLSPNFAPTGRSEQWRHYRASGPDDAAIPCPGCRGLPCSASTVAGNFSGASSGSQTLMASQIGVNCAVVFAPSPLSTKSHAIFEVAVPLVVTMTTDPLYFLATPSPTLGYSVQVQ